MKIKNKIYKLQITLSKYEIVKSESIINLIISKFLVNIFSIKNFKLKTIFFLSLCSIILKNYFKNELIVRIIDEYIYSEDYSYNFTNYEDPEYNLNIYELELIKQVR